MPITKLTPEKEADAIACANDFAAYAKDEDIGDIPEWTEKFLQQRREAGCEIWVYQAAAKGDQVDAILTYQIRDDQIAPDAKDPEPWMQIVDLMVRASEISPANRIKTMFLAVRGALPEAILERKAVGLTAEFDRKNTELRAFMDAQFGGITSLMWEESERFQRFWIRASPDLRFFNARARQAGADTEPITRARLR